MNVISDKLHQMIYIDVMYKLLFADKAAEALERIPLNIARLIHRKLDILAENPLRPNNNIKAVKARCGYRLRVGDWRVIYELEQDA